MLPRRIRITGLLLVWLVLCLAHAVGQPSKTPKPKDRPAAWAEKLDRPGLPNLHKVDDGLYRGAQPEPEGIRELEKLGIKTIINLRTFHSDEEILGESPLDAISIPVATWNLTEEQIVQFLQIAADPKRRPVFVHCQHGADRTGTMCAAYRIVVQNWTKPQAIEEMTDGGFGYHAIWKNLVSIIENMDVEKIRTKAGVKKMIGAKSATPQ